MLASKPLPDLQEQPFVPCSEFLYFLSTEQIPAEINSHFVLILALRLLYTLGYFYVPIKLPHIWRLYLSYPKILCNFLNHRCRIYTYNLSDVIEIFLSIYHPLFSPLLFQEVVWQTILHPGIFLWNFFTSTTSRMLLRYMSTRWDI